MKSGKRCSESYSRYINKHGFSNIFPSVPVSKGRVPEDHDFYCPHAYDTMNGNPFAVGSRAWEPDVFAARHIGHEVAAMLTVIL